MDTNTLHLYTHKHTLTKHRRPASDLAPALRPSLPSPWSDLPPIRKKWKTQPTRFRELACQSVADR